MNLRTIDPNCASGGDQNPPKANIGHGCVNMVHVTKVVTHAKDYALEEISTQNGPPKKN